MQVPLYLSREEIPRSNVLGNNYKFKSIVDKGQRRSITHNYKRIFSPAMESENLSTKVDNNILVISFYNTI